MFPASWTSSCGHSLGMRDGFIEDFQIWSPSEEPNRPATSGRPGDVGWCPRINDVITPFIQVNIRQAFLFIYPCVNR